MIKILCQCLFNADDSWGNNSKKKRGYSSIKLLDSPAHMTRNAADEYLPPLWCCHICFIFTPDNNVPSHVQLRQMPDCRVWYRTGMSRLDRRYQTNTSTICVCYGMCSDRKHLAGARWCCKSLYRNAQKQTAELWFKLDIYIYETLNKQMSLRCWTTAIF